MPRLSHRGGSVGANPEVAETLKWIAKAWREQLVLYTDSKAYSDPGLTPQAALSLEQGLGSTVQCGRQSWAQYRAQRPVTPAPSCPGRHGVDATSRLVGRSAVSSRRPTDVVGVVGRIYWA